MRGHVYVVAGGKGGVGKTVTAVNLAIAFRLRGRSAAVVDADLAMANVGDVLGLDPEVTLHDVLSGEGALDDAILEPGDGFAVVPGDRSLRGYATADPARLGDVVDAIAGAYEYVVVDTGAGVSHDRLLPLGLADEVILVTTPDAAAVGDARKVRSFADLLGKPVRGVVVTRADEGDAADAALDLGVDLLAAVPEDRAVPASVRAGQPLELHDDDSPAAAAYRELAATLLADAADGG